jgi:ferric-dicitrate binding protein FerR (iron transport regulator)
MNRPTSDAPPETLDRLARLAREAGSGGVSEREHEQGKQRLLATLAARRRAPARSTWWLAAAAMIGVIALGIGIGWPRPSLGYLVHGAQAAEGGYIRAPEGGEGATIRFSEGTEVALAGGGRGRIAEVSAHGARVVLESGRATLRVQHLPAAQWSVEAGPYVIVVTGTAFDVQWAPAEEVLEVRLHVGSVTVRGPLAPTGIPLHAGQQLVARTTQGELRITDAAPGEASAAPDPTTGSTAAPAAPSAGEPRPVNPLSGSAMVVSPPPSESAAPSAAQAQAPLPWSKRVAAGKFREVLDEAESRGIDATVSQASLADLGALADAARYAGRTDVARRALLGQRMRFAGSSEARTAAFLLGRIADDAQGSPAAAIGWYDNYLAEAPSGQFASEALGRKMIATRRTSGPAAARAVAEEYLRRFPQGGYAAAAKDLAPAP